MNKSTPLTMLSINPHSLPTPPLLSWASMSRYFIGSHIYILLQSFNFFSIDLPRPSDTTLDTLSKLDGWTLKVLLVIAYLLLSISRWLRNGVTEGFNATIRTHKSIHRLSQKILFTPPHAVGKIYHNRHAIIIHNMLKVKPYFCPKGGCWRGRKGIDQYLGKIHPNLVPPKRWINLISFWITLLPM